jgi:two-component system, LytTR family, sensor kinase
MPASPFSSTKNKWIFLAVWFTWVGVHFFMLMDWNIPWHIALSDSVISNALLAGACYVIINTLGFYRPQKSKYLYLLVWCLVLTGFWSAIAKMLLTLFLTRSKEYAIFLDQSMPVRIDIVFLVLGCATMMGVLWYSLQEQQENANRKKDAERLAKDAELYKLRQQLQPHFLFNSLNSISALAGSQPERARQMVYQLSEFLRGTLKKEEHQWITLEDELQHLQLYLDIEKVRFGHRLQTSIRSDPGSLKTLMPPMILQPIVENAIKFGLYDTTEDVTIAIEAYILNVQLIITVTNPFDPATSPARGGTVSGAGFGLSSLERRLYLLFARNDLLTTSTKENLFTTTVKIPPYDQSNPD